VKFLPKKGEKGGGVREVGEMLESTTCNAMERPKKSSSRTDREASCVVVAFKLFCSSFSPRPSALPFWF